MQKKNSSRSEVAAKMKLIKNMVILSAGAFFVFGLCLFLDTYGLATFMQLTQGGINKMIGGVAMIIAVIDIIIVPRILTQTIDKHNEQRNRQERI